MHRVAQVVQELANDLTLVLLLYPAQDSGVGRGRGDSEAGFQVVFSVRNRCGGTIDTAREFPCSLKKLPAAGKSNPAIR
jgi:hypothetical protein